MIFAFWLTANFQNGIVNAETEALNYGSQEGVASMCQVMEDYAAEKVKEKDIQTATNLLKNGVSVSLIVNSIPTLTQNEVEELSRKVENNEI